jgi:hypothetical protein
LLQYGAPRQRGGLDPFLHFLGFGATRRIHGQMAGREHADQLHQEGLARARLRHRDQEDGRGLKCSPQRGGEQPRQCRCARAVILKREVLQQAVV